MTSAAGPSGLLTLQAGLQDEADALRAELGLDALLRRVGESVVVGSAALGLDHRWSLDLWFVDEPARQPDLRHLHDLLPRPTDETRRAILEIKTGWCHRREYGVSVTRLRWPGSSVAKG